MGVALEGAAITADSDSHDSADSDLEACSHDEKADKRADVDFNEEIAHGRPDIVLLQPAASMPAAGPAIDQQAQRAKYTALLAQVRNLRARMAHLEKDVADILHERHMGDEGRTLLLECEGVHERIAMEEKELTAQRHLIKDAVAAFCAMLIRADSSPDYVTELKIKMQDIQTSVLALKDSQRQTSEQLLRQEKVLSREVEAYKRNFQAWAAAPASKGAERPVAHGSVPAGAPNVAKDLPPDVAAFDLFLQNTGGLTGGWDDYDHGVFLKHRQRTGGCIHLDSVAEALPTKPRGAVAAHEEWYCQMLALRKRKAAAIADWKTQQQQQQQAQRLAVQAEEREQSQKAARQNQQRKEREEARRQKAEARVQQWRQEKERQQLADRARAERELAADRERQLQQEVARQAQAKAQVRAFQAQRQQEQRAVAAAEASRRQTEQATVTASDLARFRERDQLALAARRTREEEQRQAEQAKQRRLERLCQQVQVSATREPSRLTQPTAAIRNRMADRTKQGGQVIARAPPKLAVPSWRQGL